MPTDLTRAARGLIPLGQAFAATRLPLEKLRLLWAVGDLLQREDIQRPHAAGVELQQLTRGIVTRSLIFRGAKVRSIWSEESHLLKEAEGLRSIQYFYDMLALIDPVSANQVTGDRRAELFAAASRQSTTDFREFLKNFKRKTSGGILGQRMEKPDQWDESDRLAMEFSDFAQALRLALNTPESAAAYRSEIPEKEREGFVNLLISLASPLNKNLRRDDVPEQSLAQLEPFRQLYSKLRRLSTLSDDRERARLRRRLSSDDFAGLAGLMSALRDESARTRFLRRSELGFDLAHAKSQ